MPALSLAAAIAGDSHLPARAWLIVGLLCVVACLNYLDRVMLTTMRESVKDAITMTDAQFGLLTSVFLWVYGGLSPFAGFLADRWSRVGERGRIFVAIIGMCLAAPAIFLTANTETLAIAIAGLMLFGFARAATDGNTMPILCMVSDPRYRATGFGVLNLFACGIGGFTIYAGGILRDAHVNVRNLFCFSAGGLLICAVLLACIKPRFVKVTP